MSSSLIITPPAIVNTPDNIIFLAGPIQGAPDWQTEAAGIIHDMNSSIIVASPRRYYEPGTFHHDRQVDWETHFLRRAGKTGVIIFWLAKQALPTPDRAYAQTTRFELGEWKTHHQYEGAHVAVGIEDGFEGEAYIRRRLSQDCPDIHIAGSLEELCTSAVTLIAKTSEAND